MSLLYLHLPYGTREDRTWATIFMTLEAPWAASMILYCIPEAHTSESVTVLMKAISLGVHSRTKRAYCEEQARYYSL